MTKGTMLVFSTLAAFVIAEQSQAAGLAELVARGYRLVSPASKEGLQILTRHGRELYVYDEASQTLRAIPIYEMETPLPPLAHEPLPAGSPSQSSQTAVQRMTGEESPIDAPLEAAARAAAEQYLRDAERQLARLEGALRPLLSDAVAQADIERGLTTLTVKTAGPDQLIELLQRINRGRRPAFEECQWSACLGSDLVSVTGHCGSADVEFSSAGSVSFSARGEGRSATATLSLEGLTLSHGYGSLKRAVTLPFGT